MDQQNDEDASKCSDIESPTCTACGKEFPLQKSAFCAHPVLNVIICKACNNFYKRSSFSKDENGIDNSCRWCGNGGDLICCDSCSNAFHKKCIIRNVSKESFNAIAYSDVWACFICDPSPISKHVELCKNVLSKMSELEVSCSSRNSRKPFLSPNSKMPPKVAMSRCIENSLQRSKVFRDIVTGLRQKLESNSSPFEIKKVGERLRNCIKISHENNANILKSIDQVLQRLNLVSEDTNDSSNNSGEMKEADSQNLEQSNISPENKNNGLKLVLENDDTEADEEEPMETNNSEKLSKKNKKVSKEESNSELVNNAVVDSDDEKLFDIATRKIPSLKLKLERMKRKNRPMPKSAKARQVESEEEFETCDEGGESAENESETEKAEEIEKDVDKLKEEECEESDESSKPLSKKRSKVSNNRGEGNTLNKSDENCDIEKTEVDSKIDKKADSEKDAGRVDELKDEECPESDESSKPLSKKRSKVLKNRKEGNSLNKLDENCDIEKTEVDSAIDKKADSEEDDGRVDELEGEECPESDESSKPLSKKRPKGLKTDKNKITKASPKKLKDIESAKASADEEGETDEMDSEVKDQSAILADERSKLNDSDSELKEKSDLGTEDEGKLDESVSKRKKQSKKSEKVGDENGTSDSKAKKQSKKSDKVAEIGEKKGKKNSKKSKLVAGDKEKLPAENAASEDLIIEEDDALSEEEKSDEVSVDLKGDVIESSVSNEEELDENTAASFKRKLFDNLKLDETDDPEGEMKNEEKESTPIKSIESEGEEFAPKADPVDENGWKNEAEDLENEIAEKLQKKHAVMGSPDRKVNAELSTPKNDEILNDSKVDSDNDSEKTLILSRSTSKTNSVEDKAKKTPRSLALKKSPETTEKKASENSSAKIKPCLFSSSTDEETDVVKNEKAKLELLKILRADSSDEEMKPADEVKSVKAEEKVSKKFDKQKKFDSLLKSVNNNTSDELSGMKMKNSGEKKSPRKLKSTPKNDFASPLDDPKLKMKAVVVVRKMRPVEIEFVLENGVKAYKRRQRGINSDDEEFLRACDFRSLRLRKKSVKENAEVSEESDIESKAKESKKRPMRGAKKKSSRLDNLLSGDESSAKSEDDGVEDTKKRINSSDSEPTFKTADQLAKESLLKDLVTTSSEDGDEEDDDDVEELDSDKDTKKISKKSKRKASSESDEWKKFDSEDDFVPVKKNRRLRSKLTSNDSDSNESTVGKKTKKRRRDSDGDKTSSSQNSTGSKKKNGKRKRRRIKVASSSDSSVQEISGDDSKNTPRSRKNIRKLISDHKLTSDTKAATREEDERKKRVAELQKEYNEEFKEDGEKGMRVTTKLRLAENKDTGEIIEVNENLIRKLKPHQVEGVKFMWECVGESIDRLDTTPGSGCILAHCMGLGKTLQVITFLHTVLTRERKNFPRTALVVCPLNIVLNWYHECSQWLDDVQPSLTILEMSRFRTHPDRAVTLKNWYKSGGILIIGYDMFRNLVQENNKRIPKSYRDIFHSKLINPGPDIVVCDEGHILKNANTGVSKAMTRISTRRRIILTGTPLQNNLTEYHCMVNFVKENLLGNMKEFQNRFVNPINNGQHTDSTSTDVRIMKNRAHVLHKLLDGCVQRRDYNVLTPFLPPKYEYVVDIRLTEIQIKLYTYYLENMCSRLQGRAQLFADYQNLMKIWTHPRVIRLAEIRQENKANYDSIDSFLDDNSESSTAESSVILDDSDSDKPGTSKKAKPQSDTDDVVNKWKTRSRSKNMAAEIKEDGKKAVEEDSLDSAPLNTWWTGIISEDDAKKVEHGGKLLILFDILKQCEEIGDKVLLFSQSLLSLDFIESIINGDDPVIGSSIPHECKMVRGFDYFRLDGSTSAENRSKFTKMFNNKKNLRARLFLISTKAGSLGINLVAANRVIIFDASWNPTHDIQSIFRVYRFGQVKPVYIYRFVSHGTMEEKIYDRQVTKQSLACRVIDEQQIERHFSFADLQELYTFQPENVKKRSTPVLPKDKLLADLLSKRKDLIVSYHEHDSLLVNVEGEELTEAERKCAWVEYSFDRTILTTEGIYNFDIHQEVQDLQIQFPGLNVNDLSAKLNEKVLVLAAQARLQRQQQQQLLLQQKLQQMTQQNLQQMAAQQNYQHQTSQQNALHSLLAQGTNMTPAQYQQLFLSARQSQNLQQKYYKTNDNRHLGKIDLNQMVKQHQQQQQQNQSLQSGTVGNAMVQSGANKPKSVLKPLEKPFQ